MRVAWQIAVAAAWLAGLELLSQWSATTPALCAAAAITVAAGLLVGRAWIILLALGLGVAGGIYTVVDGCDPDEYCDLSPLGYAILWFGGWAVVAGVLAVGVLVRLGISGRRAGGPAVHQLRH